MTDIPEFTPSAVAAVIEGSFMPPMESTDANILFRTFLSDVTKDCDSAGASMIGHVKANIISGKEMMSISSTTEDGNVRTRTELSMPVENYDMTVNVIVYGITEDVIAKILTDHRAGLGDGTIEMISETGCNDPECDDPECRETSHRLIRIE